METGQAQMPHKVTLQDRKQITMTGVTEILSFDEEAVILQTGLGNLVVQGKGLRLKTLSPEGGQVRIDGTVRALFYEEARPSRGGIGRFFR